MPPKKKPTRLSVKLAGTQGCKRDLPGEDEMDTEESKPMETDDAPLTEAGALGAAGDDGAAFKPGDNAILFNGTLKYEVSILQARKYDAPKPPFRGRGARPIGGVADGADGDTHEYYCRYTKWQKTKEEWVHQSFVRPWSAADAAAATKRPPRKGMWVEHKAPSASAGARPPRRAPRRPTRPRRARRRGARRGAAPRRRRRRSRPGRRRRRWARPTRRPRRPRPAPAEGEREYDADDDDVKPAVAPPPAKAGGRRAAEPAGVSPVDGMDALAARAREGAAAAEEDDGMAALLGLSQARGGEGGDDGEDDEDDEMMGGGEDGDSQEEEDEEEDDDEQLGGEEGGEDDDDDDDDVGFGVLRQAQKLVSNQDNENAKAEAARAEAEAASRLHRRKALPKKGLAPRQSVSQLQWQMLAASRQTDAWQQAVREQTHDERQVIIPQQDEDTKTGKAAKGAPKGSKRRKMGAPVKSFGPLV